MSFANFGIGLGAFSQGFMGGVNQGTQLRALKDQGDIRRLAKQGIATAKGDREAAIDGRIERTGLDGRDDFMGEVTTGYKVDGKDFNNPQQARVQAERGQGSVMDYFMRDAAPKIGETFLAQGNIEKAEAWNQWISDSQTRRGMEHWASALRAAQMGDNKGFVDAITQAYNSPGYADDGLSVKSHRINDGGSITIIFERDGEEFEQTFENTEDLQQMAIGLLSPNNAFEITRAQAQSAAEARAKAALEDKKFQQGLAQDTHRQNLRDRSDANKEGRKQQQAITTLRAWGFTQDEIRDLIPRILGISDTRAQISETDLRVKVMETLSRNNPRFSRMEAEDRERMIDEMTEILRREQGRAGAEGGENPAAWGIVLY